MQMDRRIEAGYETDANRYVLEGLVPFRYASPPGGISFCWSTVDSTECVSCHLYSSTPDESFNLIVLRHVTNPGVRVLVSFPVPPLFPMHTLNYPTVSIPSSTNFENGFSGVSISTRGLDTISGCGAKNSTAFSLRTRGVRRTL
jgi:hypothetical protein